MYKTLADGFYVKSTKNISKNDFYILCNDLNNTFNEYYGVTEYSFLPEAISEGGILFKEYPGKVANAYKSMRIFIDMCGDDNWPALSTKSVMDEWKECDDKIISEKRKLRTFLKADQNAPIWTLEELQLFEKCFDKIGLKRVGKYPSEKSLR